MKKNIILFPFILFIIYLSICLLFNYSQRSLMYFPTKSHQHDSSWKQILNESTTLGIEKIVGENIDNSDKITNIIIFHGNAGNASDRTYYQTFFNSLPSKKYRIIIHEYPGYGFNYKENISKETLINHGRDLIFYVKKHYSDNIILVGESIGNGIASQLAVEFSINKFLLITPYSSISKVAQSKFWFLPVSFFIKDNFDNVLNLKKYKGQTFFIIAQYDQIIPPKFAIDLYNEINSPKQKIIVMRAGHNNWLSLLSSEQFEQIDLFLK